MKRFRRFLPVHLTHIRRTNIRTIGMTLPIFARYATGEGVSHFMNCFLDSDCPPCIHLIVAGKTVFLASPIENGGSRRVPILDLRGCGQWGST